MASLAETLITGVQKTIDSSTPDFAEALQRGSQIAAKKQELDLTRQEIMNKTAMLDAQRDGQAVKEVGLFLKMSPRLGAVYTDTMAKNAEKRGAPYSPEFLKGLKAGDYDPVEASKALNAYNTELEASHKIGKQTNGLATARATFADIAYGGNIEKLVNMEKQETRTRINAGAQKDSKRIQQEQFLSNQLGQVKQNFDTRISKDVARLDAANNSLKLLSSDEPISSEVVKTQLARLSGEVGALPDSDIKRFGGSQALFARAEQFLTTLSTGKLTPANKRELTAITNGFRSIVVNKIIDQAHRDAKSASKRLNVSEDEVFAVINPVIQAAAGGNAAPPKLPLDKISAVIAANATGLDAGQMRRFIQGEFPQLSNNQIDDLMKSFKAKGAQ